MEFCRHIVIVPLPPMVSLQMHLDCVVSFSGMKSLSFNKKQVPCSVDPSQIITHGSINRTGNHVTFPMVDSYFHLGYKIINMVIWTALNTRATKILYLDKDILDSQTSRSLENKFKNIPLNGEFIVGDIMNCLTPANQFCCCNNKYYAGQYDLSSPFQVSHSIVWGGAGIGFNRFTLAKLLMHRPYLLYASDQTLSSWAHISGIKFRQASWSSRAHYWCSSGALNVKRINESSWMCPWSWKVIQIKKKSTCKPLKYLSIPQLNVF